MERRAQKTLRSVHRGNAEASQKEEAWEVSVGGRYRHLMGRNSPIQAWKKKKTWKLFEEIRRACIRLGTSVIGSRS